MGKNELAEFRNNLPWLLMRLGWSDKIYLDWSSKINISSMRERVGLCIQTGNVSRTYADLLKLQALFFKDTIDGGIIIVPVGQTARTIGQNIASYERLYRELSIFDKVVTLPLIVIGFEK